MKLTWTRQQLHLRHTFTIARGSQALAETLLVQIEHDGLIGFGEAVPNPYYQQDLASAEAALAGMQPLLGDDPFRLQTIIEAVLRRFDHQRAAVAALDAALHDWIGKRLNVPVWQLLGLDPARVPLTSFTIGIDDLDAIARKVAEAADYPVLKIKLGTDYDLDILRTIRRLAPRKTLRADANAAWSPSQAIDRLNAIVPFAVEFIEQPVPPGDNAALAEVRRAGIVPVLADESCVRPADLPALVGCVDGVNIKLSKCGGIRQGLEMIHLARGLGLKVMLGCMIESSLGIAAAAQLAPLVDWLDLDGHLLLADDPFAGIGGAGGKLTLSSRPGLGVHPRP